MTDEPTEPKPAPDPGDFNLGETMQAFMDLQKRFMDSASKGDLAAAANCCREMAETMTDVATMLDAIAAITNRATKRRIAGSN